MHLKRSLILASTSPRRAELLRQIGLTFEILSAQIDEPPPQPGGDVRLWAVEAAVAKAHASAQLHTSESPFLILGADTVVLLPVEKSAEAARLREHPVQVLGKPTDHDDARRMLTLLSGREHIVMSAIALLAYPEEEVITEAVETRVSFRTLSPGEIEDYIATGEPLDKAGAYGIQGQGAVLIDGIKGDYYSVVGLPLTRLWLHLAAWRSW